MVSAKIHVLLLLSVPVELQVHQLVLLSQLAKILQFLTKLASLSFVQFVPFLLFAATIRSLLKLVSLINALNVHLHSENLPNVSTTHHLKLVPSVWKHLTATRVKQSAEIASSFAKLEKK